MDTWRLESATHDVFQVVFDMVLGREHLNNAPSVSSRQAVIRIDDGEAFLESVGVHPTRVMQLTGAVMLSNGRSLALLDGDEFDCPTRSVAGSMCDGGCKPM